MRILRRLFAGILLLVSIPAYAASGDIVAADSTEGLKRLERAEAKIDFLPLANFFQSQQNDFFCGVASSTIVLNALKAGGVVTQDSFFDAETNAVKTKPQVMGEPMHAGEKPDYGYQLAQLGKSLETRGLRVALRVVDERLSEAVIRKEMIGNLQQKDDYVIVNYSRKVLGQNGGGHFSPLAAYDSDTDSVLILDVNPSNEKWVWVKLSPLIQAMKTFDTVQNRGYLLVARKSVSA